MKNLLDRKSEADQRVVEYNKLTPAQKLMKLDLALGGGIGAKKQRQRLAQQIEEEKQAIQSGKIPEGVGDSSNKKKPYQKPKRS